MLRSIFSNLYVLVFLNGFLIATLCHVRMEATYEEEIFQAIRNSVDLKSGPRDNPDSLFVRATHACHELMTQRQTVFEGTSFAGMKSSLYQPLTIDLMTANGACGSYAVVLARLLNGYGYPVRIAQMKAGGVYAAHNIVEVESRQGWVVLDGLFDLSFRKPGRGLASFADVQHNWEYYRGQLPKGYDPKYRYEDVRYSNWTKIPVLLPGMKKVLDLMIGREKADAICIRSFFLCTYSFASGVLWIVLTGMISFTFVIWFRSTAFSRDHIPLTFPNLVHHLRLRRQVIGAPRTGLDNRRVNHLP